MAVLDALRKLRKGKNYKVTVEAIKPHDNSTTAQKALWWVWMGIIGDYVGDTKEGVYEDMFKESPILKGRGISDLSVEEMSSLMTITQVEMSKEDIYLPGSHDEYYEALEQQQRERGKYIEQNNRGGKG